MHLERGAGYLLYDDSGTISGVRYDKNVELPVLDCDFIPSKKAYPDSAYWSDGSCYMSMLDLHRRYGHFWVPGLNVKCPDCSIVKGQKRRHA